MNRLFLQSLMLVSSKLTIYRLGKRKETTATAYVKHDLVFFFSERLAANRVKASFLPRPCSYSGQAVLFWGLSAFATAALVRERFVWLDDTEKAIFAAHFSETMTQATASKTPINTDPHTYLYPNTYPNTPTLILTLFLTPTLNLTSTLSLTLNPNPNTTASLLMYRQVL